MLCSKLLWRVRKRQVSSRGVSVRDKQRPSFKTCHVIREEIPQWKEEGENTQRQGNTDNEAVWGREGAWSVVATWQGIMFPRAARSLKSLEPQISGERGPCWYFILRPPASTSPKDCLCLKPAPWVLLQSCSAVDLVACATPFASLCSPATNTLHLLLLILEHEVCSQFGAVY